MPVGYSEPYDKDEFVLHVAYEAFRGFMRYQNHWGHHDFSQLEPGLQKRLKRAVDQAVRGEVPDPVWGGSWSPPEAWALFISTARQMAAIVSYEPGARSPT